MKHVIFFMLISLPFMFTHCDFINTKILGKESPEDTMAAYQARLDSIRRADSIQKVEQREADSLARLDSIKQAKERAKADSLAKIDSIEKARAQNKYHIISGSFRNENYAQRYKNRMLESYNYDNTRILRANNGFNLVSIKSYPNYRQALNELRSLRNQGNFPVWVYKSN